MGVGLMTGGWDQFVFVVVFVVEVVVGVVVVVVVVGVVGAGAGLTDVGEVVGCLG